MEIIASLEVLYFVVIGIGLHNGIVVFTLPSLEVICERLKNIYGSIIGDD